ncbi:hypothetical protein L873DRAFT_1807162 [Choiromyces venosus 120613-1]|uniref:Uncharacterized protein n=1 Tax=Choiromyces venosus 120613-1 TaxID=1336337 RepID=A0A3N4JLX3_9PEZI|nr:hypothetical protein L873DRAFT_1807162 [Choiromyces venosus 120613-1]
MVHCSFKHVSARYHVTYETVEQVGEEEVRGHIGQGDRSYAPPCQDSYAIGGEYAGASGKALMYRTENLANFSFV